MPDATFDLNLAAQAIFAVVAVVGFAGTLATLFVNFSGSKERAR